MLPVPRQLAIARVRDDHDLWIIDGVQDEIGVLLDVTLEDYGFAVPEGVAGPPCRLGDNISDGGVHEVIDLIAKPGAFGLIPMRDSPEFGSRFWVFSDYPRHLRSAASSARNCA